MSKSSKGGEFERYVSKFLTKWLTGKEKPYMYWRQDASGAIATVNIENDHMTGDIKSIHPDSKFLTDVFSIELKTGYPSTSFWQHFKDIKFGIEEFWIQALADSMQSKKNPMLIYRKKGRKPIVGINKYIEEQLLKKTCCLNKLIISWCDKEMPHESSQKLKIKLENCILYDMESFFESVNPDDIRSLNWLH